VVAGAEKLNTPLVVVFSGPPATGKSTLADTIGRELPAPVVAWDWLVAGLTPFAEVQRVFEQMERDTYRDVGYSLMSQLVEKQLRNEQSVILDCVVRTRVLDRWSQIAATHGARFHVIECICSDIEIHESRVAGRVRGIPGWNELDWKSVQISRATYEPLAVAKIVVDAVDPLEANLARVRRYLGLGKDGEEPREER
jgi:predicted kinase